MEEKYRFLLIGLIAGGLAVWLIRYALDALKEWNDKDQAAQRRMHGD